MTLALPQTLVLAGAGKMGGAMLDGWLKMGLDPRGVNVIDPAPSQALVSLCRDRRIALNAETRPAAAPQVLVLALKPQIFSGAERALAPYAGADTLVLSIMAGITIAGIARALPDAGAIVRAMPNTPAAIGRGICGLFAGADVPPAKREIAQALMRAVGGVEWVGSEALIDAVTAVSGSGPAYVFYLAEALAEAGAALGLPPDVAMRLARATIEGAGELMFQSATTPAATLRENVTSPAGTTAAALAVLMGEDGLAPLMKRAVAAARQRAEELAA